jgi:dienelactone hydrolase
MSLEIAMSGSVFERHDRYRRGLLQCAGFVAAIGLSACSSRPTIVDSTSLWPFEQLTIRTSVGAVQGYLYKPRDAAVRLVVALQTSPCPTSDDHTDAPLLGASGVVWDQFKYDSLFFQFERPGGTNEADSVVVMCERADRSSDWHEALVDSLQAVRRREHLEGVPTTYLGIGKGAALALRTALNDPESSSVVLMSAALNASETEEVSRSLARSKVKEPPSILFLHGAEDASTPLEQIESMAARLSAAHVPTRMIVFDEVGADFGLTTTQSDCLDLAAMSVGAYVRFGQRTEARPIRVACNASTSSDQNPPLIERIERL